MTSELDLDQLRRYATGVRDQHTPSMQGGPDAPYDRCANCHYTRHPCDPYEMADAVLALIEQLEQREPQ